MSEELREYKRRQTRCPQRRKKQKFSTKKLFCQLIISIIILTLVVFVKVSDTDISNNINKYLQTAFLYRVNTNTITDAISNFLKIEADKGEPINEEIKVQTSSVSDI